MNIPDPRLPLRPNVCMLLANSSGKLFLGERAGEPGVWQFPQGGVEQGSGPEETVIKELREELGVPNPSLFKIIRRLSAVHEYNFDRVPDYAVGKWRGQSQTFWLVRYCGSDKEINPPSASVPEFSDWRWCTLEEIQTLAEPKRLLGYQKALKEAVRLGLGESVI